MEEAKNNHSNASRIPLASDYKNILNPKENANTISFPEFGSDYDIDKEKVNHPQHYNQGGIECIDAMKSAFGETIVAHFCICNAFKYLFRHREKGGFDDIRKAQWYLDKYLEIGIIDYPDVP